MRRKNVLALILATAMLIGVMPITGRAASDLDWSVGNSDLNIQSGGTMLSQGEDFYYVEDGIYREKNAEYKSYLAAPIRSKICDEIAGNLNLYENEMYFTVQTNIYTMDLGDAKSKELLYTHDKAIDQMYVISGTYALFLSDGDVWEYHFQTMELKRATTLNHVASVLPTSYGNIYLIGDLFQYTVYANEKVVLTNVRTAYTDSDYLILNIEGTDYQVPLQVLFSSPDVSNALEEFHVHGVVDTAVLLDKTDETPTYCPVCDEIWESGDVSERTLNDLEDEPDPIVNSMALSLGQQNIVKRARQQYEIKWTPLADRYQWGQRGIFSAGTTYIGIPYGQPVNTGYVPWTVSFGNYLNAVNQSGSKFYTEYSTFNKTAPAYSSDCSSFVSYAWQTKSRHTTYSLPDVAQKVGDQSIYSLQVGDIFNHLTSHVVLVTSVGYNSAGQMVTVDIMEQTPSIVRLTRYGEGGTKTLAQLQSTYLGGGYVIYRNPNRDQVTYTHDCAVPIDGDYCKGCKASAPIPQVTSSGSGKTVTLKHIEADATMYYTLNGSVPTTMSTKYTGPITITGTSTLKAIAVTPRQTGSFVLEYGITMTATAAPTAAVTKGQASNGVVESGSQVSLSCATANAAIYYTTDGSNPTTSSTKYTAPITIKSTTTIKAIAIAPGLGASSVATFQYKVGKTVYIDATAGGGGSISPSGRVSVVEGGSKSFTITPNNGYSILDVKVDGKSVGAVSSYTFSSVKSNASITAIFQEGVNTPFTDVASSKWYAPAVGYAYERGLFSGVNATTFSPDLSMTRGMFITVTGRMAKVPSTLTHGVGIITGGNVNIRKNASTDSAVLATCSKYQPVQIVGSSGNWYKVQHSGVTGYVRNDLIKAYSNQFTDLKATAYYTPYIEWAYLMGIVNGTSKNAFSPNANITREQMCVILYQYTKIYGIKLPVNAEVQSFQDDKNISTWAKEAVSVLQRAGIISGVGNNKFEPKGTASRAQVAQIFQNLDQARLT